MTLILVLLCPNLILGLQVDGETISQSQKYSETFFWLKFSLYLSKSWPCIGDEKNLRASYISACSQFFKHAIKQ